MIKKKQNNNLVCVTIGGTEKHYFTSNNRAGYFCGMAPVSVKWAIEHNNVFKTNDDRELTIDLVDGSEVPYKLINN